MRVRAALPLPRAEVQRRPAALTMTPDGRRVRCWKADVLGAWPHHQTAAGEAPAFPRGDTRMNATRLSKAFEGSRGLTTWRMSVARGRPRLYQQLGRVPAVNDVSFSISPGEVLGLVGESGCGKSTLGRLLLQLLRQSGGSVEFDGADLACLPAQALSPIRKQAQIVFQNAGSSLNLRLSVGEAIERPLALFSLAKPRDRIPSCATPSASPTCSFPTTSPSWRGSRTGSR